MRPTDRVADVSQRPCGGRAQGAGPETSCCFRSGPLGCGREPGGGLRGSPRQQRQLRWWASVKGRGGRVSHRGWRGGLGVALACAKGLGQAGLRVCVGGAALGAQMRPCVMGA